MKELDDYHRHEALDRACMLAEILSSWLLQHPYIESKPKLGAKVGRAIKLLNKVYNEIGKEHLC